MQAAVLVGVEGGLQGRNGLRRLADLEIGAAQDRPGPQQLRVATGRPLEEGDGLCGLLGLDQRLAQQEGQLRRVRLAGQEVFQDGAGPLGVVGDEEHGGQLASDPKVLGPGLGRPLQILDRLADEPPLDAQDLDPPQRGFGRRRELFETAERLVGQGVGGAGQPEEAFGRAEGLRGRKDRRVLPRAEIALQAPGTAVGGRDAPRLLPFDRGPLRVAFLLVDPGQGLVGLRQVGPFLERLPVEPEGVGGLALGDHHLRDQPQDVVGIRRGALEALLGDQGHRLVAAPQPVPRARVLRSLFREHTVLSDGGLEAPERPQRIGQPAPGLLVVRLSGDDPLQGLHRSRGLAEVDVRGSEKEGGGQQVGPESQRGLEARHGLPRPAGHGECHPQVQEHARLVGQRPGDLGVESGRLVEAARGHRLPAPPGRDGQVVRGRAGRERGAGQDEGCPQPAGARSDAHAYSLLGAGAEAGGAVTLKGSCSSRDLPDSSSLTRSRRGSRLRGRSRSCATAIRSGSG